LEITMSFLALIVVAGLLAYVPQYFFGNRRDHRMAMRHGLALGLLFTGIDHFVNAGTRYVPMIPDPLADWALALVYFTGAAELAGAIGLLVPVAVFRRLGLPNLQRTAGIALAVMFAFLVVANINVALKGTGVAGLEFGRTYFVLRPFFQPIFIAWALYCVGVPILPRRAPAGGRAAA
jgi:uncharacterized membrane protein